MTESSDHNVIFAAWLSKIIEESKFTYSEIAREASCDPRTVKDIASNAIKTPSEEMKNKIHQAIERLSSSKTEQYPKIETVSTNADDFSDWLNQEIIRKGISKNQLAKNAGCHPTTITNIISGRIQTPSKDMISKISNALNIQVPENVTDKVNQSSTFDGKTNIWTDFNPFDIESVPKQPGVYALFGPTDVVLYVGQSKNVNGRIKQHSEKKWFIPEVIDTGLCFFEEDKILRNNLEKILITFLKSNAWLNKSGRY
jgi:transcriptional regulator with XRE-family HTH domain